MHVSDTRHVKAARKRHSCTWCYEPIEQGSPYKTWFTFGECVTARMHHECYEAMLSADLYGDELPPPGTFRRGCSCGENEGNCACRRRA